MLEFNLVLMYVLVIVLAILATMWTVLEFNPAGIPPSLKVPTVKQWCLWKPSSTKPGQKIPYSPFTLKRIGVSIDKHKRQKKKGYTRDYRKDWGTFDEAYAAWQQNADQFAGIMFLIPSWKKISNKKWDTTPDGLLRPSAGDLDKVWTQQPSDDEILRVLKGEIRHTSVVKKPESEDWVIEALRKGLYVDFSQSGTGAHPIDFAPKSGGGCKDNDKAPAMELYGHGRPLVMMGHPLPGSARDLGSHLHFIAAFGKEIRRRHNAYRVREKENATKPFWESITTTSTIEEINKKLTTAIGMPPLIQDECIRAIANITGRGINALKKQLKEIREQRRAQEQKVEEEPKQKVPEAKLEPLSEAEVAELLGPETYTNPLQFLMDTSQLIHLGDKQPMTFLEILIHGAILERAFQVIVQGPASTGKSDMVGNALRFLPPEFYKILAGATGAYLKRFLSSDLGTLLIIYLKETGGIADDDSLAAQVLKMISTDDRGGIFGFCARADKDWQAEDLTLPENLSFIATNAGERVPHQNLTRMWALECDSSATHNNAVIQRASLGDTFELKQNREVFERKIRAWHQGIIPRIAAFKEKAHIPFLSTLRTLFTAGGTPLARHVNKFRSLIETITQIHAACAPGCRPIFIREGVRYVVSLAADFAWACQVGWDLLFNVIAGVSTKDRELLNRLREIEEKQIRLVEQKQSTDIQGATPIEIAGDAVDIEYAKKRLRKLLAEGYVIPGRTAKDGRVFSYRLSTKTFVGRTWTPVLPTIEADIAQFCESNHISLPPSVVDPLTLVGDRDVDGEAS